MAQDRKFGNYDFLGERNTPQQFLPANRRSEILELDRPSAFLDKIGRPELKEVLTSGTPWVSVSMEVAFGNLPFTGGMGVLEGDKVLQAERCGLPFYVLTLVYSERWYQETDGDYNQVERFEQIRPEELGLERVASVNIKANEDTVPVDVYQKRVGSGRIIALHEPGLRELYYGSNNSEHRLYQQVVLGFGGQMALRALNRDPSVIHLNESAKVFSAVAFLDEACSKGMEFDDALRYTRDHVVFTNHTLVPAAVSTFSSELIERYVMPNVKSEEVKNWLREMVGIDDPEIGKNRGSLNLSTLSLELAGKLNGVSVMHAEIASKQFRRLDHSYAVHEAITNGVYWGRWTHGQFLDSYLRDGVIDEFYLPTDEAERRIVEQDSAEILAIKAGAKMELLDYLRTRRDQDGNAIDIRQDQKILDWSRRLASYKRPFLLLEQPEDLADLLEGQQMHLIIAGKAHPTDEGMKRELREALFKIAAHPILRERAHFVQDYDEELASHLEKGADIWLNTPIVGQEACGTSSFKAITNHTIVVSTEDGGLADVKPAPYIVIENDDVYSALRLAASEADDSLRRLRRTKGQLAGFVRIVTSARMMADYVNFVYPKEDSSRKVA